MTNKIGISLDDETLKICDKYSREKGYSRSEFIASAIHEYVSVLDGRKQTLSALERFKSSLNSRIAETEKINKRGSQVVRGLFTEMALFNYTIKKEDNGKPAMLQ